MERIWVNEDEEEINEDALPEFPDYEDEDYYYYDMMNGFEEDDYYDFRREDEY